MVRPAVLLLADMDRPNVAEVLPQVREMLAPHADIIAEYKADNDPLDSDIGAGLAVVVGGDGSLISQARRVVDLGIALIGVNVGRLGFLAEFDVDSLRHHAAVVFSERPPINELLMLDVEVVDASGRSKCCKIAMNDAVVTAGPPFSIIEIGLSIDGNPGPAMVGDGMIVATPTGSTAYSVSAGGPIVHRAVQAMVITPVAAHSLAFRPIVVSGDCRLEATVVRANPGTTLVLDGQDQIPLTKGDRIRYRRYATSARFVTNPDTTYWHILTDKLRWGARPRYRAEAE